MKYIGYHEDKNLPLKQGDIVIIPRGTPFKSTHPSKKEGLTKRAMKVRVHHLLNGQELSGDLVAYEERHGRDLSNFPRKTVTRQYDWGTHEEERVVLSNPSVCWAGSGGYWVEVDLNLVQKV